MVDQARENCTRDYNGTLTGNGFCRQVIDNGTLQHAMYNVSLKVRTLLLLNVSFTDFYDVCFLSNYDDI